MQSLSSLLFVADRGCRSGALVALTYFVTVLSRRRRRADRQRLDRRWVGAGIHTYRNCLVPFHLVFRFLPRCRGRSRARICLSQSPRFYYGGERIERCLTRRGSNVEARPVETVDAVIKLNCIKQRRPTSQQAHKPTSQQADKQADKPPLRS